MKTRITIVGLVVAAAFAGGAGAQEYSFQVITSGLQRPTGIAIDRRGNLFFTQIPMPGMAGGMNSVSRRDARTGAITVLHMGEPEPTFITVDRHGNVYWTCKSAGVILGQSSDGVTSKVLTGLTRPSGIAVDTDDRGTVLYFTQIPTPGVPGGQNGVFRFDHGAVTTLHMGEPEPTAIVVDKHDDLYWTCKSAGVILKQTRDGLTSKVLGGLDHPQGIALDREGHLFFTEVPTPGVPGSQGGRNKVWRYDTDDGALTLVHAGDPEPASIAVGHDGDLYWTCASAGVIVKATPADDE